MKARIRTGHMDWQRYGHRYEQEHLHYHLHYPLTLSRGRSLSFSS
ncbi:hypothetical protein [Halocynthiibacter sp.]